MNRSKLSDVLITTALSCIGIMLIWKQESVSSAIIESLKNCAYRIIPSLFAMTVISTVVSRSGVVERFFCRSKINANIFIAFIFGNIGGYPIGAKLISEMVDNGRISPHDAELAMCFCYGSGPAFAAGVAGSAVFGDVRFGLAALAANITANLTMYLIYLLKNRNANSRYASTADGFSTKLVTDSVSSATNAMVSICSMIIFFSALKAVIESLLPNLGKMKYFSSILEISNIANLSARQGVSLAAVAILLGFGGICVHMQLLAIINGRFDVKLFYLSRFFALPLTGLYAYLIEKLLYTLGIVSDAATKIRLSQSPSLIPILCVAAMVFITLSEKSKRAG